MDECTVWELNDYIEYIPYIDRSLWETSRLCAYIDAKAHFKGIKKYSDLCKFKWETEEIPVEEKEKITDISNKDIDRLKQLSKKWGKN